MDCVKRSLRDRGGGGRGGGGGAYPKRIRKIKNKKLSGKKNYDTTRTRYLWHINSFGPVRLYTICGKEKYFCACRGGAVGVGGLERTKIRSDRRELRTITDNIVAREFRREMRVRLSTIGTIFLSIFTRWFFDFSKRFNDT